MLVLNAEIKPFLTSSPTELFDQIMALRGTVYRQLENRCTQRIVLGDQPCFIKQHFGIGWREIFKNLFQLRLPVLSAKNEWRALERLQQLNIPVPKLLGYGARGMNPARVQSFLLTRALPKHISLEDLVKTWKKTPPSFHFKQQLIAEVARIAETLHTHGMNHRDFYICHFLLDIEKAEQGIPLLYLIDLHRAEIRRETPKRWVIKDLAGLYFSCKESGLSKRDLLRFMQKYRNTPLGVVLTQERTFWQKVKERGDKLYERHAKSSN